MQTIIQPNEYLTASQLARKLDQPNPKVFKRIHDGEIVPDIVAGRAFLFHRNRLESISRLFQPIATATT